MKIDCDVKMSMRYLKLQLFFLSLRLFLFVLKNHRICVQLWPPRSTIFVSAEQDGMEYDGMNVVEVFLNGILFLVLCFHLNNFEA